MSLVKPFPLSIPSSPSITPQTHQMLVSECICKEFNVFMESFVGGPLYLILEVCYVAPLAVVPRRATPSVKVNNLDKLSPSVDTGE